MLLLTLFCVLFSLNVVFSQNLMSRYDHSAFMDSTERFQIHWSVDMTNKKIKMALDVKATGWVGFGISKGLTGKMKGADIVIGWVDAGKKGHLSDRHGVGNSLPLEDKEQNYRLLASEETNGKTIIEFERDFFTCDENDLNFHEGTMKLIWAFSSDNIDPTVGDSSSFKYHKGTRGSRSINILGYVKNAPVPADAQYFDILQRNYLVPAKETTYHCLAFKIPDVPKKHHVIEIAPLIPKGNEGVVHHMVIYECAQSFSERFLNHTGECYTSVMPADFTGCIGGASAYAWAIGGSTFKFPAHTGIPIGRPGNIKYVILETHYNNPQNIKGIRDSSGLRFYYTNKTRKYDAATLTVGHKVKGSHLIPPKVDNWLTTTYCPSDATKLPNLLNSSFPNNAIKIFGAQPHSHYAGRGMWLKHIAADGKEFPEIYRDDNYDFDFQQSKLLEKEVTVNPGEALNTYCRYNTMSRADATTGGLSSLAEMCMFFILYYPRQENFLSCESEFTAAGTTFTSKYANQIHGSFYSWRNVTWNKNMVDELRNILSGQTVNVKIRATGGAIFRETDFTATRVKTPWHNPVQARCTGSSLSTYWVPVFIIFINIVLGVMGRY